MSSSCRCRRGSDRSVVVHATSQTRGNIDLRLKLQAAIEHVKYQLANHGHRQRGLVRGSVRCPGPVSNAASSTAPTDDVRSPRATLNVPPAACGTVAANRLARDHVTDEYEVTGLLSVAVDDRSLASKNHRNESRYHRAVLTLRVLPGTKDVEVSQASTVSIS